MLKLLRRLNKTEITYLLVSAIFIIAGVWLDLKVPDYMSNITKLVQTEGSSINDILEQGAYMLGCAILGFGLTVIVGFFMAKLSASFAKNLRKDIFNKTLDFSMEEIKRFSTSSLITRTTNDVTQIQTLLAIGAQLIIKSPIMAIWAVIKIYNKNFTWSLITGGAVFLLLLTILVVILVAIPRFKKIQRLTDKLNEITRENLMGIRVIHAYNAIDYQEKKFEKANSNLTNTQVVAQKVMAIIQPVMSFGMQALTLAIYVTGAYMIAKASMQDKINIFSDMVVFSSYAVQVLSSFIMLAFIFIMYPRASVSANRILEVLETKIKIKDGNNKKISGKTKKSGITTTTIEFKNVSFKYPDATECILNNISFSVSSGETLAIIGSTGSGKSTLVNLIPRFYDVTTGSILVNGIDVKAYCQKDLHNLIGYVSQKPVIFSDTVYGNVSYGKSGNKIDKSDVKNALKVSQAEEFVQKLENKDNTFITRGGTNISGGQKQRISIARAVARKPQIYIFDDSFSALDYKTDFNVRKALKENSDATKIIVAQRIGTIKDADKIIVLEDGKIAGIGRHDELIATCKEYQEIAISQM